jgi:hypothetical protein
MSDCKAVLNIKGENFVCDWPGAGHPHDGWAHANKESGAVWLGHADEMRTPTPYWTNWSAEDKERCHDHNCGHMRGDHSSFSAQCLQRLCPCDAFLEEMEDEL